LAGSCWASRIAQITFHPLGATYPEEKPTTRTTSQLVNQYRCCQLLEAHG